MDAAHHLVLLAGALGLLSIFAGLFLARFGTPLLLAFLAIGLLFGKQRGRSASCSTISKPPT